MPTASPAPPRRALLTWAALLTVYVVWGSTYFGIAVAIESLPPFLMGVVRFTIAGSLLIAWDLLRNPGARRLPNVRQLRDSFVIGGLLLGLGNGFVAYGEQTVPSGIAAILVAMIPVWFAILGWLYFRDRLPRIVSLAIVIGFAGVGLLVWPVGDGANRFDLVGVIVLIVAPLGWAHGSLYSARRATLPPSPLTASGLQMLSGAVVGLGFAALTGEPGRFDPAAVTLESALAVAYLVVFGSMVAFTAYAWLLRNAPLSLIGTYAYVNPVVAVGLGGLFLAEPISPRTIVASAVILVAVAIIVSARAKLAAPAGSTSDQDVTAREPVARVRPAVPPPAQSG
jgi:drug/metabolite transporter (DMT)-like permease